MRLYDFQREVLDKSRDLNRVAYYYDMGLGKTFIGSEKLYRLNEPWNLVVCQKSKVKDWCEHLYQSHYIFDGSQIFDCMIFNLTDKEEYEAFIGCELGNEVQKIGVINYELLFRRPELAELWNFTLLLDESSMIQNEKAKRTKFILDYLRPKNVILLSGTPTGGKYEKLWSQLRLLGWNISKTAYWNRYIQFRINHDMGFPMKIVTGYKNISELKRKMAEYGCFFKKTAEVINLPEQNFIRVRVPATKEYKRFQKKRIVTVGNRELVGDTTLTKMLYERQLCGFWNDEKFKALKDLLSSSEERFVIFYNFTDEMREIVKLCKELEKPVSLINGETKDLRNYKTCSNSVTIVQYQAGAMGINLQRANKLIYFTPPLSSELFEQSKKRIHRIGQIKPCFYYQLICEDSLEEKIYTNLALMRDYTERLFEKKCNFLGKDT